MGKSDHGSRGDTGTSGCIVPTAPPDCKVQGYASLTYGDWHFRVSLDNEGGLKVERWEPDRFDSDAGEWERIDRNDQELAERVALSVLAVWLESSGCREWSPA